MKGRRGASDALPRPRDSGSFAAHYSDTAPALQPPATDDDTIPVTEKLARGRAATVAALRALADALDGPPLADAAEAMVPLGPRLDELARWAELAGLVPPR